MKSIKIVFSPSVRSILIFQSSLGAHYVVVRLAIVAVVQWKRWLLCRCSVMHDFCFKRLSESSATFWHGYPPKVSRLAWNGRESLTNDQAYLKGLRSRIVHGNYDEKLSIRGWLGRITESTNKLKHDRKKVALVKVEIANTNHPLPSTTHEESSFNHFLLSRFYCNFLLLNFSHY